MELIYLWVDDYKGIIKQQGFNFSNKHNIKIEEIKRNDEKIEVRTEIQEKNNDFIFKEKDEETDSSINNIIAIIGANGTGKTTLLNYILKQSMTGFAIYKLEESEKEKNNKKDYLSVQSENCEVIYNIENKINIERYNLKIFKGNSYQKDIKSKSIAIYYDNIFNNFSTYKEINSSLFQFTDNYDANISTNYLYFNKNQEDKLKYSSNETKNILLLFGNDIYKKIQENIKIFIPKEITIENIKISNVSKKENNDFVSEFKENIVYLMLSKYIEKEKFEPYLNEIIEIFEKEELENKREEELKRFFKEKFKNKNKQGKEDWERIIIYENMEENNIIRYIKIIDSVKEFIKNNSKTVKEKMMKIELSDKIIRDLKKLLESIKENSIGEHFFKYEFDRKYSSGEMGMLTLFSRLLSIRNNVNRMKEKEVILLMDEPDIFAHPEWQRCFIDNLLQFLPKVFKNKNIKIILTSHSPFVVADLPKDNIIVLDKEQKIEKAFASNIYELFKNTLFMTSTFGEFAKKKIEEVIKDLKKDAQDITEERKKEMQDVIQEIGEDILRNKLEKMYKDKFGNNNEINLQDIAEIIKNSNLTENQKAEIRKVLEMKSND